MKEITTLEQFAEYINNMDEFISTEEIEQICAKNGWVDDCGTTWGICHTDTEVLEFGEDGNAYCYTK